MGDAAAEDLRDMLLQEHCDTERRERGDSLGTTEYVVEIEASY